MTTENIRAGAIARPQAHEGGYVDHPKDPGGATSLGVTIGTLTVVRLRRQR